MTYSDEECIDALYRVRMLSESAYQSQRFVSNCITGGVIHSAQDESDENASSSRAPSEVSSVTATSSVGNDKNSSKISLDTEISAGGFKLLIRTATANCDGSCFASTKQLYCFGRSHEQYRLRDGCENPEYNP